MIWTFLIIFETKSRYSLSRNWIKNYLLGLSRYRLCDSQEFWLFDCLTFWPYVTFCQRWIMNSFWFFKHFFQFDRSTSSLLWMINKGEKILMWGKFEPSLKCNWTFDLIWPFLEKMTGNWKKFSYVHRNFNLFMNDSRGWNPALQSPFPLPPSQLQNHIPSLKNNKTIFKKLKKGLNFETLKHLSSHTKETPSPNPF